MEGEELVIFTDLFGATPFHAASVLSAQTGCHVVCGVNLALLLDFAVKRESISLQDMRDSLQAVSKTDYRWIEQSDIILIFERRNEVWELLYYGVMTV